MIAIPNTASVSLIKFSPRFSVMSCGIGDAPFWGTIDIEFKPRDKLLEFSSVESFVSAFGKMILTIEDVTRLVFDECERALGDIPLRVTVRAETTVHAPAMAQIEKGDW